jgi:hypothetical protein
MDLPSLARITLATAAALAARPDAMGAESPKLEDMS